MIFFQERSVGVQRHSSRRVEEAQMTAAQHMRRPLISTILEKKKKKDFCGVEYDFILTYRFM